MYIVLDVSEQSTHIAYGIVIEGTGEAWIDGLAFDAVDSTVRVTNITPGIALFRRHQYKEAAGTF